MYSCQYQVAIARVNTITPIQMSYIGAKEFENLLFIISQVHCHCRVTNVVYSVLMVIAHTYKQSRIAN